MNPISNFQLMAKPTGSACNLNCTYCFYLEKAELYPERKSHMKMESRTLENYIRQTIEAQQGDIVDFIWQGGEPTLAGLDFYREAVALQKNYGGKKLINNFFQTNGININDEWAIFFRQHKFLIGISLDGDRISNDAWRLTRGGKSSFDAVMRGLAILKKHQTAFNTLTVVNADNVQRPLEIYHFLKRIGSRYMQFIPLIERQAAQADEHGLTLIPPDFNGQCRVTEWSVPPVKWGKFMNLIFDHWIAHDLGTLFVMNFEQTLAKLNGQKSSCVINETCGENLIIEANGDIYSCDHFVYPENKLGNINHDDLRQLIHSSQHQRFGNHKLTGLSQACLSCSVRPVCNGGCPKHRFALSESGKPDKHYLCEGFSTHLLYVLPRMQALLQHLAEGKKINAIKRALKNSKTG